MPPVAQADRPPTDVHLRRLLAGLTAVRGGDFSMRLPQAGDPLMDEIVMVFNGMTDQLARVTSAVTTVAREVGTDGKLGGQVKVPGISGRWLDLTDSVNAMAGNLTAQVRSIAEVATAVAEGDLSQKIRVDARGEILELKETINTMVDQLSSFAAEVTRVAREVGTEGKLGGQADVQGVSGTWKDLTAAVNVMAANLTDQVRAIATVTTAVAQGDLSHKIRVDARGEILELKETINTMVETLGAFAVEVTRVAREVGTEGILGGQATVPNVAGTWKDLTENVNSMANNLTSQVRNIAQVTTAMALGDLSKRIDVDARGEILELKTTFNTMVDQLSSFAAEVTRVAREVGSQGRLGGQAEVDGVSGTWKRLTENVNELAGNLTRQVRAIAEVTSAVATGDLTRSISVEAEGEVAELKDNINAMVRSLRETTNANQEQEWLQTNLARIARLMQGQRDLAVLAELIMDELIPLVGAQHGTFFLAGASDGDTCLRLMAGYGLRADSKAPSQFRLGQTLIGQVAKTRKPIIVTDVPPGYIRISSSLGSAVPLNLIVLPILFEDRVLGVMEAGSFSGFTQVHRDFLEQLMELIGVNVNTILANDRTAALLAESQRLTAELQARSSELQARQDELQRSNADLEDRAAQMARQNRDIELKNAQIEQAKREIEERARQLDQASRYKSQFLANMSHELRTPLNSLLVLARLLSQNPEQNLTPSQVEYAKVIHSSGSDLLQLINDILDLSKVEAGKLEILPEKFLLTALVDDLEAVYLPLTAEKGLAFAISCDPQVPAELFTDRHRLRQILHNLLSNAVKFTERGKVEVRVAAADAKLASRAGGDRAIAISVTDTGIGVAEENLATIFGAFQQGDGTTNRRYGGTGLGLAIGREMAAHLGGEITVHSELGVGSIFTLLLPTTWRGRADAATTPDARADVPSARYDTVAGQAADSLTGPLDASPALRLATVDPVARTGDHTALRAKRVLIVDDDPRNVFALTSVLELYGITVIHAPDGPQGIEAIKAGGVDLVLMDVMMPQLDGHATTRAIREMPQFADLPVIAVTARAMQEDMDKSIASGASDYVAKPVDLEELLTCMERWIDVRSG